MEILRTENLCKVYGKGDTTVKAVRNVNLSVNDGEFVVIIGPSGSGKSTLLHLLGGLDDPTAGKVFIDGKDIYSLSNKELTIFRRRRIGFIFQYHNLVPVLSAKENIELPLLLDHRGIDEVYINELIDFMGLKQRRDHLPNSLSGGQQQRVGIARAMAGKPSIILADEPTGNLDSKTTNEVIELMRISIKKYHQTLIMITHNEKVALKADRVITIEDGIISEERNIKR